ncbi:ABC transporter substrate-binding protein [Mesorhizobium escarrei]|uniref:Oligopeptide ABC transporter substrate-binding protein n=1 Tax=Mesorhizobium escarrei TaxID=666018 RepID=A0ABM9DZX8_9HYPH|nr:ABC transporter substrate-binding protein [Mesorhizobium escarrei]CAH2402350.1 Oligopeptide ABC transporter substrate-binding protein [Mesorhizobium escarrei]
MNQSRLKAKSLVLIVILSAGVAALSGNTPVFARDLTIAVPKNPDNLDPATENSNPNLRVVLSLYDTLVRFDYRNDGKIVPGLATEWKALDPKTLEFKLRPGVVFHNGDTFDANDVIATFSDVRLGRDKSVPTESEEFLGGIERIKAVDNMTVRIHIKAVDPIALDRFATFPAQIISETALKQARSYNDFTKLDAGSGPYALVSHEIGGATVLKKFDAYWGEAQAAADKVTFVTVPELSTRVAGLLSGQFDMITEIGTDEFLQIEGNPNGAVAGGPIETLRGVIFDSIDSPIADPRIRHAMNLAVDRRALVKGLYDGRTDVPRGWQVKTFGDMYLQDRPMDAYDPQKARELLKEASYDGKEIVWRTQHNYYTKQGETAQIVQSMWKAVGLNVKLEFKENWTQVLADTPDRAIIDASSGAYYPDPIGQFWRRLGPGGSFTKQKFFTVSADMAALGEELSTSVDTGHRRAVFAQMLDKFDEDPHSANFYTAAHFIGVRKDRLTYRALPTEYLDLTTTGVSFR